MTNLTAIRGTFFRSIVAERRSLLIAKQRPTDIGRYHGPGQHALYMTPKAEWARLVAHWYSERDGHPRIMFPLEVSEANVLDLGNEDACRGFGLDGKLANQSWKMALDAGETPPSWTIANAVRAMGADGLIDHSRMFPGAWHVTLFDWNEPGKPTVQVTGDGEVLSRLAG